MPPKPKTRKESDDYLPDDEDQLHDDFEDEEEEEEWDPEYADHTNEKTRKKDHDSDDDDAPVKKDEEEEEEDVLPADSDAEDEIEVMEYQEDEDEIEPPAPELIKNKIVVPPDERTTSERLSIFECARVLGDRASHINNKARPYIDTKNYTSSLEIAYNELIQKRNPMAVIRDVGQNKVEIWRVKEMTIPKLPPQEWFMTTIH